MLRTITDSEAIRAAQEILTRRVEAASARTEPLQLGFQGGGLEAKGYVLLDLNHWIAISELELRFWNALGLGDPAKDETISWSGSLRLRSASPSSNATPPRTGTRR